MRHHTRLYITQIKKPLILIFLGLTLLAAVGCSSSYDKRVKERGDSLRYTEDQYDN